MKNYNPTTSPLTEHVVTVTKERSNLRIDKFLSEVLQISRNKIQEAIANGSVYVNRHLIKSNYVVHPEDEIVARIPHPMDLEILTP